jgi:phage shock protein A
MGLFKRFRDLIRANINHMISRSENPEKLLNQMVLDMNEQLIESKKGVAGAIADEKRLERQIRENQARAEEWEQKAMLAVRAGKDDLAKEALLRKQEHEKYILELKPQWEAQKQSVEKLKESLRALQRKIEEAGRKKNILVARARRAEAQKQLQATMGNMGDNSAFEAFDRMAAKVDQLEAETEALAEIEGVDADASLEAQFKQLEGGQATADKLLEDLKGKMRQIEDKT